ncbi:inorganic diphosphatase, partial [Acinetobacter baumannii]
KVFAGYAHISDIDQVSAHWCERIGHFFEHYKDLEKGKWVKVTGWRDRQAALEEVRACIARYQAH